MITSGLSELELRSIVERAFLPLRCTCTIANDQMTVQISDPVSGRTIVRRASRSAVSRLSGISLHW